MTFPCDDVTTLRVLIGQEESETLRVPFDMLQAPVLVWMSKNASEKEKNEYGVDTFVFSFARPLFRSSTHKLRGLEHVKYLYEADSSKNGA